MAHHQKIIDELDASAVGVSLDPPTWMEVSFAMDDDPSLTLRYLRPRPELPPCVHLFPIAALVIIKHYMLNTCAFHLPAELRELLERPRWAT